MQNDRRKKMIHSTSQIGLDELKDERREAGDLCQNVVHIEVPFGKPVGSMTTTERCC